MLDSIRFADGNKRTHGVAFPQEELTSDSLKLNCVTKAREFNRLALYKDPEGRLYRPRKVLTEELNSQETDPLKSESQIWFDCYLTPIWEGRKPIRPELGEKIKFKIRADRKSDLKTIKEFDGEVLEIHWGEFARMGINKNGIRYFDQRGSDTLGLVKIGVDGWFDRSLIIDTEFNLKKYSEFIPL